MLELENGESKKKIQVSERVKVAIAVTSSNINKGDSLSLKVGRSFILFYFKALFPCTKVYVLSSSYNFYSCLLNFIIFLSLKLLWFLYPFFLFLLIYLSLCLSICAIYPLIWYYFILFIFLQPIIFYFSSPSLAISELFQ